MVLWKLSQIQQNIFISTLNPLKYICSLAFACYLSCLDAYKAFDNYFRKGVLMSFNGKRASGKSNMDYT